MATCMDCDGKGYVVTCIDDLCYGGEECIHGDGETPCGTCHGYGSVGEDNDCDED